ncbi:MAG: hypothetical protein IPK76_16600 [Lewinellaceae bacterium]|nr:hypothetical protein [Lewinellaceae bacterium]
MPCAGVLKIEKRIRHFLASELRLVLHDRKTAISPTAMGITFLGQRIFTTHRRLRRENLQRFRKRLTQRLKDYRKGDIHPEIFELQLNSWLGHARQADTWRLRRKIFYYLIDEGLNLFEKGAAWKLLEQPRNKK